MRKFTTKNLLNLFLDLDKGEAEAIVLATEKETDLIILDETLGILIKAKQLGHISNLKSLLLEL